MWFNRLVFEITLYWENCKYVAHAVPESTTDGYVLPVELFTDGENMCDEFLQNFKMLSVGIRVDKNYLISIPQNHYRVKRNYQLISGFSYLQEIKVEIPDEKADAFVALYEQFCLQYIPARRE